MLLHKISASVYSVTVMAGEAREILETSYYATSVETAEICMEAYIACGSSQRGANEWS